MIKTPKTFFVLIAFLGSFFLARADYPVGKGRVNLIISYNNLSTKKFFDKEGKLNSYAPGEKFVSHSYNVNLMYGITRNLDFFVSAPLVNQSLKAPLFSDQNQGIGDVYAGVSYHVPSADYKKYFSLKTHLIIPGYKNNNTPYLGYSLLGAQIGANYSFSPYKNGFCIVGAFYVRFFDSDGPNQFRGTFILGKMLDQYTPLTLNFTHTSSWSGDVTFNPNPVLNKDFYSGNLSMTIGRRITRVITPSATVNYTVYGRNMGQGLGAGLMLAFRLP
jgi:hypothetical protein